MSFQLLDYPGIPSQCAMCGRFDCSKGTEKWVHLLTLEDRPCIGMSCLRSMAENAGLTKGDEVVRETVRPPTDEEIGAEIGAYLRRMYMMPIHEVANDDHSADNARAAAVREGSDVPAREEVTQNGTEGTVRQAAIGKPTRVQGGNTTSRQGNRQGHRSTGE